MQTLHEKVRQALGKYDLKLDEKTLNGYQQMIEDAQVLFPLEEQHALIIKLLHEWRNRKNEKIISVTSEACRTKQGTCVTTFGVLSTDWPGLSDTCLGIIHEMGWNIYFNKGISYTTDQENLGIILIGIRTEGVKDHQDIVSQARTILKKFHQAAVGTKAKTFLISEEIRKLEIYSQVIAEIEKEVNAEDLEAIIGLNGEAVKYFAARSRDYIENRNIIDIARQIILNHDFIKKVHQSGNTIELDIRNFETKTEGTFTGVTVAGPAHLLHLEDCLKTIEMTIPHYQLKHNREFSTSQGIAVYRIEFVDSTNSALTPLEQERLKKAFSAMVLNLRRDRAKWIESIGGFEQYARAIIPLLVREARNSGITQVYESVGQATDLFIDFKIIVVIPESRARAKKRVSQTVNGLESVSGFHIHSVKPPKTYGNTEVFIIDLKVQLTDIDNTEAIYLTIKSTMSKALGDFRDFDEGMRTLDTAKLKAVRERLKDINKSLIRELYYAIEDFYRLSAPGSEIESHIRIAVDMINLMTEDQKGLLVLTRQTGTAGQSGRLISSATLLCLAYPHEQKLLKPILAILEPFEVTLSRLEKSGRDVLICRITKNDKPLKDQEIKSLTARLNRLGKTKKRPA